jgi:hypothetical protein
VDGSLFINVMGRNQVVKLSWLILFSTAESTDSQTAALLIALLLH